MSQTTQPDLEAQHAVRGMLRGLFQLRSWLALTGCCFLGLLAGCENAQSDQAYGPQQEQVEYVDPIQAPSREGMNADQIEFWDYLDQFNRLPNNPSEEAIAVYHAKGIAPDFTYLKPSKQSVFGNVDGLKKHRKLFVKRYPWVASLLEKYDLEIPVSKERFSGSPEEVGSNYEAQLYSLSRCKMTDETELRFVRCCLEGLLVLDYVYARGTKEDRKAAIELWRGAMKFNDLLHPFDDALAHELLIPASYEIGWAIIADHVDLMWGIDALRASDAFRKHAPVKRIQFAKWALITDGVPRRAEDPADDIYWGLMHNWRMESGLRDYCIYVIHCTKNVRPKEGSWGKVVKNVFRIHFGKGHKAEYKKYRQLLDAAYPESP